MMKNMNPSGGGEASGAGGLASLLGKKQKQYLHLHLHDCCENRPSHFLNIGNFCPVESMLNTLNAALIKFFLISAQEQELLSKLFTEYKIL